MGRFRICLLAWIVSTASLVGIHANAAEPAQRPNILFIFTDDHSHRTVSCYDEAPDWVSTPNIDRLAAEGIRFTAGYSGTWCLPSRAMMVTGRHPHGIQGIKVERNPISEYDPARFRMWPEEFQKSGYQTALIGKWHLSEDAGHGRAWTHSVVWNHAVPGKAGGYYSNQKLNFDGGPFQAVSGYSTDNYTQYAIDFIRRDHQQPWYLWLCYDAVHGPYKPAGRHASHYTSDEPVAIPVDIFPPREGKPDWSRKWNSWKPGTGALAGLPVSGDRSLPDWVRLYQRAVLAVDDGVGRLLETLAETGQLDNTLIVFTADQGFAWGQHGFKWKVAPYDGCIRTPFIVRLPGGKNAGAVCHHPVGALDLIPTFHTLAGAPHPWPLHGNDLTPLFESPQADWPHPLMLEMTSFVFGHDTDRLDGSENHGKCPWWWSLRVGQYKYIRYVTPGEIEELYDLQADPDELHNLAQVAEHRQRVLDMRAQLVAELRRTEAPLVDHLPEPGTFARQ